MDITSDSCAVSVGEPVSATVGLPEGHVEVGWKVGSRVGNGVGFNVQDTVGSPVFGSDVRLV